MNRTHDSGLAMKRRPGSVRAWWRLLLPACCGLLLAGGVLALEAGRDGKPANGVPIAIVVHPDTAIDNVSMSQLRAIFLGDQQFWDDNTRIVLLVRAPAAYERDFVLTRIYEMNEQQFRRYWIAKMFRAEIPSGPKVVFSTNMARELVTVIEGSITFMPAADVTPDIKMVRVDGTLPGDPDYPLK